MADDIVALLRLFEGRVPDRETCSWVLTLASCPSKWPEAHRLFDRVRDRSLSAMKAGDRLREAQYMFEEICLKSLYNETPAQDSFDSDSPHWIIKCAIVLARRVGLSVEEVIAVVASEA
jgi:hypothetical protein